MKISSPIVLWIFLSVSPIVCFASEQIDEASEIATLLAQGAYDQVVTHFDSDLAAKLPASQLEGPWLAITNPLGSFEKIQKTKQYTLQGNQVVDVTCAFHGGAALVRVVFGNSGKVAGLWVYPLSGVGSSGHN
jgi:hypothetical protein